MFAIRRPRQDSCGPSQELGEWARLLNATGNRVLVENCFDNASYPRTKSGVDDGIEAVAEEDCPMNMCTCASFCSVCVCVREQAVAL